MFFETSLLISKQTTRVLRFGTTFLIISTEIYWLFEAWTLKLDSTIFIDFDAVFQEVFMKFLFDSNFVSYFSLCPKLVTWINFCAVFDLVRHNFPLTLSECCRIILQFHPFSVPSRKTSSDQKWFFVLYESYFHHLPNFEGKEVVYVIMGKFLRWKTSSFRSNTEVEEWDTLLIA